MSPATGPHHVLLVPGFFGFTSFGDFAYWEHVRAVLAALGPPAGLDGERVVVRTVPTASLRLRAAALARAAHDVLDRHGGTLSIIGHSSGGLDARLLVTPDADLPTEVDVEAVARQVRSDHHRVGAAPGHAGGPLLQQPAGPANPEGPVGGHHLRRAGGPPAALGAAAALAAGGRRAHLRERRDAAAGRPAARLRAGPPPGAARVPGEPGVGPGPAPPAHAGRHGPLRRLHPRPPRRALRLRRDPRLAARAALLPAHRPLPVRAGQPRALPGAAPAGARRGLPLHRAGRGPAAGRAGPGLRRPHSARPPTTAWFPP
ncbi:MAG: hypothetical protein QM767_25405 [Anaeromyxobacter sp.]